MKTTETPRASFPILGILGLIFITLKLTGHITWSWVWVLAPFWAPLAVAVVLAVIVFIVAMFIGKR